MAEFDFDLVVIGAGSGGVRAARVAASHGAKVAICEHDRVGGTCVIRGCIPKKLLAYGAHYRHAFDDAHAYGWTADRAHFDWQTMKANMHAEIDRLNAVYKRLLEESNVRLFKERGEILGLNEIQVGDRKIKAERILIATGDRPGFPDIPGGDLGISSDQIFHLDALPKHLGIVGAGYIGSEFASIFNGFGSRVTLIHRGPQVLRGFDGAIREAVGSGMRQNGIDLRLAAEVCAVEDAGKQMRLHLSDDSRVEVDQVLFATGRAPNTAGLGCDRAGVKLDERGAVEVDAYSCTNIKHIYAVGDVTDRLPLTPVAIMEGQRFADRVFGNQDVCADHTGVPTAIFCDPEAATVGLTEDEARTAHEVRICETHFTPLRHTLTGRDDKIMAKLVIDAESDRVLGCHMVGENAAEIMQGFAIALKCGATKAQFDATVGIHPTAAEEFVTLN